MNQTRCFRSLLVFLTGPSLLSGLVASLLIAQAIAEPPPKALEFRLEVRGEVARPLKLTSEEWAALPRKTVKARSHDGKEPTYEGVALIDLLTRAGVPTGPDLRGGALALYVVIEAADGYRAVFALPELDPGYTDRVIILADRIDGQPLDAKHGPLRVIVPGEKKQARSVRQVIAIRVGRS